MGNSQPLSFPCSDVNRQETLSNTCAKEVVDADYGSEIDIQPQGVNFCRSSTTFHKQSLEGQMSLMPLCSTGCSTGGSLQSEASIKKKSLATKDAQAIKISMFSPIAFRIQDYILIKNQHVEDQYRITKVLSKNKTSTIYLAMSKSNGKVRALKEVRVPLKQFEESQIASKFKLEGRCGIIPILDHPSILRLYEIFSFQDRFVMVMEYFEITLHSYCRKNVKEKSIHLSRQENKYPYRSALKVIMIQILKAFCYLHDRKIAHLGTSSKNIMLAKADIQGENDIIAKLVGFGISKANTEMNKLTEPPKQFRFSQEALNNFSAPEVKYQNMVCLKTDIWNLGVIFFKAFTGHSIEADHHANITSGDKVRLYFKSVWNQYCDNYRTDDQKFFSLIWQMMNPSYMDRPSARQCLNNPWFGQEQVVQKSTSLAVANKLLTQDARGNNFLSLIKSSVIYKNIDQKQLQFLSETFNQFDVDHSGSLQLSQLLEHIKNTGNFANKKQMEQACFNIIKKADHDASGAVDFFQFVQATCNQRKYLNKKNLIDIFHQLDWDGNGTIQIAELKKNLGECEFQEIMFYMQNIDSDYSGAISQQQFIQYCESKFGSEECSKMKNSDPMRRSRDAATKMVNH